MPQSPAVSVYNNPVHKEIFQHSLVNFGFLTAFGIMRFCFMAYTRRKRKDKVACIKIGLSQEIV